MIENIVINGNYFLSNLMAHLGGIVNSPYTVVVFGALSVYGSLVLKKHG